MKRPKHATPDFSFLFRDVSGIRRESARIVRESDESTRIPLTTIASRLGSGLSPWPDQGDENIERPFLGISANSRHARGWIGTTLRRREMRKVKAAAARALPFNPFRASSVDRTTPICLAAVQFLQIEGRRAQDIESRTSIRADIVADFKAIAHVSGALFEISRRRLPSAVFQRRRGGIRSFRASHPPPFSFSLSLSLSKRSCQKIKR